MTSSGVFPMASATDGRHADRSSLSSIVLGASQIHFVSGSASTMEISSGRKPASLAARRILSLL